MRKEGRERSRGHKQRAAASETVARRGDDESLAGVPALANQGAATCKNNTPPSLLTVPGATLFALGAACVGLQGWHAVKGLRSGD